MESHRTRRAARAASSILASALLALGCGGESTSSDATEQFIVAPPTFSVGVRRPTGGTVSSAIAGVLDGRLDCGTEGGGADACDAVEYASSAIVTLVATPDPGFEFTGWYADCGGTEPTCTLEAPSHGGQRVVAALFQSTARRYGPYFVVTMTRPTGGTVVSADRQIRCGAAPNADACGPALYRRGQPATLTAVAHPGFTFEGWGGDCSGSATCIVDATEHEGEKAVTASFVGAAG